MVARPVSTSTGNEGPHTLADAPSSEGSTRDVNGAYDPTLHSAPVEALALVSPSGCPGPRGAGDGVHNRRLALKYSPMNTGYVRVVAMTYDTTKLQTDQTRQYYVPKPVRYMITYLWDVRERLLKLLGNLLKSSILCCSASCSTSTEWHGSSPGSSWQPSWPAPDYQVPFPRCCMLYPSGRLCLSSRLRSARRSRCDRFGFRKRSPWLELVVRT